MIWHTFFQPFIEYGFMRRALVVCLALSISTTALGVFLQLRRMSLMGDALSHAILPGVAVGYLLSGLSLLGLSSQPPTPEWGFMLSQGRQYIQAAPWLILYPGLAIVLNVIVFNLLGDRLRDMLDPRYEIKKKKRRII